VVGDKVYNGTTAATLTGGTLAGVASGDTITLTQAGSFASKDVGTGIAVTASDSIGGANNGDYLLTQPTGLTGSITPASLTVTGTVVGDKVYNGTTAATLTGGTLTGVIAGDTVTLTQVGTFASKSVGTGIAVTAADTLGGASAGDYDLTQPTGLTGTITPASLTVTGTVVGNKVYNGTASAPLMDGTLQGVISGDSVTLIQAGTFASTNVGTGIAVTAADSLSGPAAADYSITQPTGLTGNIVPATSSSGGGSTAPSTPPTIPSTPQAALLAQTQIESTYIPTHLTTAQGIIGTSSTIDTSPIETPLMETITDAGGRADGGSSANEAGSSEGRSSEGSSSNAPSSGGVGDYSTSERRTDVAGNVSTKIGATGTLKILNGGLRLPETVIQEKE